MPRNKFLLVLGIAALLVIVSAMAFMVNGAAPATTANRNSGADPDLLVPSVNAPLPSNWKARPASGAPVTLPFANTRVNNDSTTEAQNEPFVAIDPNNSKHIVVGANSWQVGSGHFEVFAYVTFDNGRTWTSSQPY